MINVLHSDEMFLKENKYGEVRNDTANNEEMIDLDDKL